MTLSVIFIILTPYVLAGTDKYSMNTLTNATFNLLKQLNNH